MNEVYIDPIYDYIDIDVFNIINKKKITEELKRIEDINHLGTIQKVYPLSKHSKFEHALGLYHLSYLATKYIRPQINRSKIVDQDLKLAAICHGIGHLPYAYATEKAICFLYDDEASIQSKIDEIVETVCKELDFKGVKKRELLKFLKLGKYRELHHWIEAYKVLINTDIPSNNKKVVARYIVDKNNAGHKLLQFLDKIDYVVRDAYYINLFPLKLNIIPFIKDIKISNDGDITPPRDFKIINSYFNLLNEKIYKNPKVIAVESIFSKIIINLIKNKTIEFDKLLNMTDTGMNYELNSINYNLGSGDESFSDIVFKINNDNIQNIFSGEMYSDTRNPFELEGLLVHKRRSSIYDYPKNEGYFINVERIDNNFQNSLGLEMPYSLKGQNLFLIHAFWNREITDPKKLIRLITEIQNRSLGDRAEIKKTAVRFILGKEVIPRYERLMDTLKKDIIIFLKSEKLQNPSQDISEDNMTRDVLEHLLKYPIKEKDELIQRIYLKNLIQSPEIFRPEIIKKLIDHLRTIKARDKHNETLKEYIKYLERIYEASETKNQWWILPSMDIMDENDKIIKELDVLSIEYININSKPIIHMDEVSITDSHKKIMDAREKFGRIRELINERFNKRFCFMYYFNGEEISIK